MKRFMDYDFAVSKIRSIVFVQNRNDDIAYRNRFAHGLAFNLGGEKLYCFDKEEIVVKQYDIIYLPKHSYYTVKGVCAGDSLTINFDIDEETDFSPFAFHIKNHNIFIDFFKKAQKSWDSKEEGFELNCKAQLYNILYNLKKEYSLEYIPSGKVNIIIPAVKYIHKNYSGELIRIEKLATMCNITPEYFRSIFKNTYGVSPINYINNLKMAKAKELIDSQMYSITAAANLSGYVDISHFSREFKKKFEVSPKEYIRYHTD